MAFGTIVLLLATIGLYGLLGSAVARRANATPAPLKIAGSFPPCGTPDGSV